MVIGACAALTGFMVGRRIRAQIRRYHPETWKSFGFPKEGALLVRPQDDSRVARADLRLLSFVGTGEYKKLSDAKPSSLIKTQMFLFVLVALILLLLAVQVFGQSVTYS